MYIYKNGSIQIPNEIVNLQQSIQVKNSSNNTKNKFKNIIIIAPKKSLLLLLNVFISILHFLLNYSKEKNICDNIKYDIVIPVNINDTKLLIQQLDILKRYLYFDKMVIISKNNSLIEENITNNTTIFINEESLIPKKNLITIFNKRGINETNRINWYHQQFLKMSYSRICQNEYYLLWDSDTIPIRPINMFKNEHPLFDMKHEHHSPYFDTLERLLPNLHFSKLSYISEHMIIKTKYMIEILEKIEKNLAIPGIFFWEKILMSIDKKELIFSGFSEFETYGTYVDTKFPKVYKHRKWSSKRDMTKYYGKIENLCENDYNWLSKNYYTITFEKWDNFENSNLKFIKNTKIQNFSSPKRFFKYFKRIIKKYKDG